jgi:hypothetical protein
VSWSWIAAFTAPAVVMALVLVARGPAPQRGFYQGTQGAVHLSLLADDGPLREGAAVKADQALRIRITTPKPGFLLVLGLGNGGEVAAYEPTGGTRSMAVPKEDDALLPGPVKLDGQAGPERIYALFTEHPIAVSDVADAVRAAHASSKDAQLPVHGAQSSVLVEKQLR